MTAKGAATLGAFLGAALAAGATVLLHNTQAAPVTPIEEVRKDIAEIKSAQGEMKADLKVIKCRLGIEGICPK